jgi:hypothetical protein
MEKIISITVSLVFSLMVLSQGQIKFYTDNGTKEITKIKCGDFDNLKVKTKLPSNINKFDLIKYKIHLSSNQSTFARIIYDGKGAVSGLKPNSTLDKWIIKPGKKGSDFVYFDGASLKVRDLCDYPREQGISSVKVTVELVGYNITGHETYWSDRDRAYKTRTKYTDGSVLAKGGIVIEQLPAQVDYTSENGVLSISKVTDDLSEVGISNTKKDIYEICSAGIFNNNGKAAVDVVMYTDENIAKEVKRIFGEVPSDLNPYEELKRDLLQKIAYNSYGRIYREPFFKWIYEINDLWSPVIADLDEKKKLKKTNTNFFTNMALWKKEKIGEYEYDVLRIPEVYAGISSYHYNFNNKTWNSTKNDSDIPGEMVVYAIKRGNYNIFIFPYYMNGHNIYEKGNEYETNFITKTIESIKYLK